MAPLRLMALLLAAALAAGAADWGTLQFLIGKWSGGGSGDPGTSSAGGFTFSEDLDGTILVRRSFSEYPAAAGRPAVKHSDFTVVYRAAGSQELRATYWDNEGHVIPYSVRASPAGVVFASEGASGTPRYRLTYSAEGKDRVKIRFEVAEPGKDFAVYLDGTASREK